MLQWGDQDQGQQNQYTRCLCVVCVDDPYVERDMGVCPICRCATRQNHCVRGGVWYDSSDRAVNVRGEPYTSQRHGFAFCPDCGALGQFITPHEPKRQKKKNKKKDLDD